MVGPNASGKSNLLDALAFVRTALLADGLGKLQQDPLPHARRGKPQELFHRPAGDDARPAFTIRVTAAAGGESMVAEVEASRSGDWTVRRESGELWSWEVGNWHFHVPDPAAMRRPVSALDRRPLSEDAGNLAAVLGRMAGNGELDDLSALVPDVMGVRPVLEERSEERSFDLLIDGEPVPGRLASDGTLRVLALLAALYDQTSSGLLMVEEIENGLHPSRLGELLQRVAQRVGVKDDVRALTDLAPRPVDVQSVQYGTCRMTKDDATARQAIEELAGDCHLIFLHSDHRERAKADRHADECVVPLVPVKETESWLLADASIWARVPGADASSLPGRSRETEKIPDPKATLRAMLAGVSHRKVSEHFAGDHVDLSVLARLPAYAAWLDATSKALRSHGFL
nr:AAA family ATPase [Nonomuraea sp. FMUSA5-5]